jgi:enamine deaminase RidA (YjgF/YER057c/UK114 family)
MSTISQKLADLGYDLPDATVPQGSYVPYVRTGNLLFVAGQGPRLNGELKYKGLVGGDLSFEDGHAAAQICALNLLRQLSDATGGSLDAMTRVVRLAGIVRCTPDFEKHAAVMNGASDLMRDVFGDRGLHVRIATGSPTLPSGMAVEVEGIFELSTDIKP